MLWPSPATFPFGLKVGDVGSAVLVHGNGVAFEVEFVGYDGHTVALTTLESTQVRPLQNSDIPPRPRAVARLMNPPINLPVTSPPAPTPNAPPARHRIQLPIVPAPANAPLFDLTAERIHELEMEPEP